jgi:hypothetical protein
VTPLIDQKARLMTVRDAVLAALELLQRFIEFKFGPPTPHANWDAGRLAKAEAELLALIRSSQFTDLKLQGAFLWQRAVLGRKRVAWMLRYNDVLIGMLVVLCDSARVKLLDILDGRLESDVFARLTQTGTLWAESDLHLWDAAHYGCDFEKVNELLKIERSADHFICDWELAGADLNGAKRFLSGTRTTIEDIVDLAAIKARQAQRPK